MRNAIYVGLIWTSVMAVLIFPMRIMASFALSSGAPIGVSMLIGAAASMVLFVAAGYLWVWADERGMGPDLSAFRSPNYQDDGGPLGALVALTLAVAGSYAVAWIAINLMS